MERIHSLKAVIEYLFFEPWPTPLVGWQGALGPLNSTPIREWIVYSGESSFMDPNLVFGLINLGFAGILIVLGVPLAMRKVPMNYLYGVRIRKSFESEANWYSLNEYGGKQLIYWSLPMVLVGFALLVFPLLHDPEEPLAFLVGLGPMSVCMIGAIWRILGFSRQL